jgi:hypothetical protein
VQGQARALALDRRARVSGGDAQRFSLDAFQRLRCIRRRMQAAVRTAQFEPMQAGRRQVLQLFEQYVERRERAPADECERAIQARGQCREVFLHAGGNFDRIGLRREVQQRTVDVEEQRPVARRQWRCRAPGGVAFFHVAIDGAGCGVRRVRGSLRRAADGVDRPRVVPCRVHVRIVMTTA